MEIWNEPITYKKGAAYLGAGFTIKTLSDGPIGALRAIDPTDRQDRLGNAQQRAAVGRVLTTGGNLVWWGTPEGFPAGRRRQDRQDRLEVPDRLRRRRAPITWEDKGEQYVAVVSGWGGAVPLWGGDVAKKVNYLEQGWLGVGVQADEVTV